MRDAGVFEQHERNNFLHGVIPEASSQLYFTEETVAGKGDCGFIALGHDRAEVADTLLKLSSYEGIRAELWDEIYEAFQTKALKRTPDFEVLYNLYQEENISEAVREDSVRSLKHTAKEKMSSKLILKLTVENCG